MRRLAPIVALLSAMPCSAFAEKDSASIEQCDTLQEISPDANSQAPKYLCIAYTRERIAHAKIYSDGQFSKAADGEYQFVNAPFVRVINGVVHDFDTQVAIASPNKGQLQFFRGVYANPIAFFCPAVAKPSAKQTCTKAPDGTYTTTHQLAIPIKDGIIYLQDPDPNQERNFCVYGRYGDKSEVKSGDWDSPQTLHRDSHDKSEYIVCMEGD